MRYRKARLTTAEDSLAYRSVIASPDHRSRLREVKALMILVDFQHFVFDFLFRSVRGDDIIIDVRNGREKKI